MQPLPPFPVYRQNGLVYVDSRADEAFRRALLNGVPPQLRFKMKEALAEIPNKGARAHAERYFGEELPKIVDHIAPLIVELNRFLESHHLKGLYDWLDATGLGNNYKMIKVLKAWADMSLVSKPTIERAAANG